MIKIQRITEDSSWYLDWNETRLLIDPWLIGPEIDGFKWLNQQWHKTKPVDIDQLPEFDAILISQSYEDHCHLPTLEKLNREKPIFATTRAFKKLEKTFPQRDICEIPSDRLISFKNLSFRAFSPRKMMDPVYYAVMVSSSKREGLFYSPHGFALKNDQLKLTGEIKVKLLVTTFTEFDLPAFLGGKVNPGLNNVYELNRQLEPEYTVNTHDEDKVMKGLVGRLAKVKYADYESLEKSKSMKFLNLKGYQPELIR